jgi:hypothetical protein
VVWIRVRAAEHCIESRRTEGGFGARGSERKFIRGGQYTFGVALEDAGGDAIMVPHNHFAYDIVHATFLPGVIEKRQLQ